MRSNKQRLKIVIVLLLLAAGLTAVLVCKEKTEPRMKGDICRHGFFKNTEQFSKLVRQAEEKQKQERRKEKQESLAVQKEQHIQFTNATKKKVTEGRLEYGDIIELQAYASGDYDGTTPILFQLSAEEADCVSLSDQKWDAQSGTASVVMKLKRAWNKDIAIGIVKAGSAAYLEAQGQWLNFQVQKKHIDIEAVGTTLKVGDVWNKDMLSHYIKISGGYTTNDIPYRLMLKGIQDNSSDLPVKNGRIAYAGSGKEWGLYFATTESHASFTQNHTVTIQDFTSDSKRKLQVGHLVAEIQNEDIVMLSKSGTFKRSDTIPSAGQGNLSGKSRREGDNCKTAAAADVLVQKKQ